MLTFRENCIKCLFMTKTCYDIFVVGSGPVGSFTAFRLADKGFNVCLVDQKSKNGDGVVCAGVISKKTFKKYDLPTESILSRIDSFTFISPLGQRLEYTHPDIFAYVVDRSLFDQNLHNQARRFGVQIKLSTKVKKIEEDGQYYKIYTNKKIYSARAVVLATGINYSLQRQLGMGQPPNFLQGAQVEIPLSTLPSKIEIHLGREFAPGSFAWIVPLGNHCARVGLLVRSRSREYLKKMLEQRIGIPEIGNYIQKIKVKPIAFGPIKKSIRNRIIAVGEAAGQIKTTTGGGISFGLLCAEIAVEALNKSLKNGNPLVDYETHWRTALRPELEIGTQVRKIAIQLNDRAIERLFTFVKNNHFWVRLLLPKINFDFHSDLLFYCLKSFDSVLKWS